MFPSRPRGGDWASYRAILDPMPVPCGRSSLGLGPITPGMGAVPSPGGLRDGADVGESGRPAQFVDDPLGAGDERRRVAGPPADNLVADRATDGRLAGTEDLEHADPRPRPEVVCAGHARFQALD